MADRSAIKVGVFNEGNIPSLYAHSFSVMKMAQGFAALGCQAQVVTANNLKAVFRRMKYKDIAAHYGLFKNVQVTWMPPSVKSFLSSNTGGDLLLSQRSVELAKKEGLDLVYARSYLMPLMTTKAGIPTIMETHTTHYDHPILSQIYSVAGLEAFKGLVTIHPDIAQEHITRGVPAEKVLVLEDGVDLERFDLSDDPLYWRQELGLDPAKRYAVYAGQLYADKGIELLLQTARKFAGRQDLIFLMVGGFERDRKHWETEARNAGLQNTTFTGFVPNAKVPAYLKAADCLLLPYRMDMNHTIMDIHTTSPLKLFEYMAAKRPIIATDIPTVAKVTGRQRSALLVPPNDIDGMCTAIEKCLADKEWAIALSENAWQDVQEFSWTRRCRKILDLVR